MTDMLSVALYFIVMLSYMLIILRFLGLVRFRQVWVIWLIALAIIASLWLGMFLGEKSARERLAPQTTRMLWA